MEERGIYEILGLTYAALCKTSDREDLWQDMYDEVCKVAKDLVEENKRLQAIIEKYETEGKASV